LEKAQKTLLNEPSFNLLPQKLRKLWQFLIAKIGTFVAYILKGNE